MIRRSRTRKDAQAPSGTAPLDAVQAPPNTPHDPASALLPSWLRAVDCDRAVTTLRVLVRDASLASSSARPRGCCFYRNAVPGRVTCCRSWTATSCIQLTRIAPGCTPCFCSISISTEWTYAPQISDVSQFSCRIAVSRLSSLHFSPTDPLRADVVHLRLRPWTDPGHEPHSARSGRCRSSPGIGLTLLVHDVSGPSHPVRYARPVPVPPPQYQ